MDLWIFSLGITLISSFHLSVSQRADVTFVLDGSGSTYDHSPILEQITVAQRLSQNLNIGRDEVRVACVVFSDDAQVMWNLDRYYDKTSVLEAFGGLKFTGGLSNINAALKTAQTKVFNGGPGDREDVHDVILLFSDGRQTKDITRAATIAMDVKAAGISMMTVAIGNNPDRENLRYFSSIGNLVDLDQLQNQAVFADFVAKLRNVQANEPINVDPCQSNPCMNGGLCYRGEDPYGWGFYCWCPYKNNAGGRLCQTLNPCVSCPPSTALCIRSISSDESRYCYRQTGNRLNLIN